MKTVHDNFAETSDEEVTRAVGPTNLSSVYDKLLKGAQLSGEDYGNLARMMQLMVRLFDTDLPKLTEDIQTELSKSSQEINIGRFLREKAIARIYLLIRHHDEFGEPLFSGVTNPDTGELFSTQEDFIGWWCHAASVSRALIFQRLATYGRLEDLGFSLERAYEIMKQRPSVITETLREIASWEKTSLTSVPPAVAENIVLEYAAFLEPEDMPMLSELLEKNAEDDLTDRERNTLNRQLKPFLRELVTDAAFSFPSPKDAIKRVKYGITGKPEIKFSWDIDSNSLVVTVFRTSIDDDGKRIVEPEEKIFFVPDTYRNEIPDYVVEVMEKKLAITNKGETF